VESLFSCTFSNDLTLVKGDIRDLDCLRRAMHSADVIVHLAAIVGYPACSKNPELAITTNIDGTRNIIENMRPNQKLVFASTGSCYGAIPNGMCTEETPLSPLSLYGSTKAECEQMVKEAAGVTLRLATIFGVSQRLRLDLLVNDLVYKALTLKRFDVYEAHFRRTFLHVRDVARAFLFAIENYEKMSGQVYNVGGDSLNYTKLDICNIIKEFVPDCVITVSESGTDIDQRNYQVSYEKIRKLGFVPEIDIRQGIAELQKVLSYASTQYIEKTKNA
jgi:nucleoside-diphosphate-sugar epimerase